MLYSARCRKMTARSLFILTVVWYAGVAPAPARAQDAEPRHGAWLGVGLGYGAARFSCDTCPSGRRLNGWTLSGGLGGTPNPHGQIGVQGGFLVDGVGGGRVPTSSTGTGLVGYYPRGARGPLLG